MKKIDCKKFTCSNISKDFEYKITKFKKFYGDMSHTQIVEKLLDEHLFLDLEDDLLIKEVSLKNKINCNDLIIPSIKKHLIESLKKQNLIKEKNKNSVKAEEELIKILHAIVNENNLLPLEERKYVSATMVQKWLFINSKKFKQKHIKVINRVLLSSDVEFVRKYHEKNNLSVKSNRQKV